jgi:hypothetical protein
LSGCSIGPIPSSSTRRARRSALITTRACGAIRPHRDRFLQIHADEKTWIEARKKGHQITEQGGECREARKFIEHALGQGIDETLTAEFYQTQSVDQQLKQST